ncbi:unnamed protein product [Acanthosepion pharaonis]|uniref:Uncharacterized protein n=1 Tax=Acanthosepion pharaonis TaxID=158019 RepID=A0A812ARL7_ACAPH|nr:unnamed protein product [Sepia pharaonis]
MKHSLTLFHSLSFSHSAPLFMKHSLCPSLYESFSHSHSLYKAFFHSLTLFMRLSLSLSSRRPVAFSPSADMGLTDIEMAHAYEFEDPYYDDDRAYDMECEPICFSLSISTYLSLIHSVYIYLPLSLCSYCISFFLILFISVYISPSLCSYLYIFLPHSLYICIYFSLTLFISVYTSPSLSSYLYILLLHSLHICIYFSLTLFISICDFSLSTNVFIFLPRLKEIVTFLSLFLCSYLFTCHSLSPYLSFFFSLCLYHSFSFGLYLTLSFSL